MHGNKLEDIEIGSVKVISELDCLYVPSVNLPEDTCFTDGTKSITFEELRALVNTLANQVADMQQELYELKQSL